MGSIILDVAVAPPPAFAMGTADAAARLPREEEPGRCAGIGQSPYGFWIDTCTWS